MSRLIEITLSLVDTRVIEIDLTKIGPPGQSASENVDRIYVNPGTVLSNYNVPLPPSPQDKKRVMIFAGGTIGIGDPVVNAFTVSATAPDAVYQSITPIELDGGDVLIYEYEAATKLYRRIQ